MTRLERLIPILSTDTFKMHSLQFCLPHWPWCLFITDAKLVVTHLNVFLLHIIDFVISLIEIFHKISEIGWTTFLHWSLFIFGYHNHCSCDEMFQPWMNIMYALNHVTFHDYFNKSYLDYQNQLPLYKHRPLHFFSNWKKKVIIVTFYWKYNTARLFLFQSCPH